MFHDDRILNNIRLQFILYLLNTAKGALKHIASPKMSAKIKAAFQGL